MTTNFTPLSPAHPPRRMQAIKRRFQWLKWDYTSRRRVGVSRTRAALFAVREFINPNLPF
jgi:hypothetical protein